MKSCRCYFSALLFSVTATLIAGAPAVADTISQPAPHKPSQNEIIRKYIGNLVAEKTKVVGYAELAKQQLKPPEVVNAQKLYIDAQQCQAGWQAILIEAVRQGDAQKLDADPNFAAAGDDCTAKTKKFITFVDDNTAQSKGALSWIGDAIDAGVKLWKAIKGGIQDSRNAVADRIQGQATWPTWGEVGASPSKDGDKKPMKDKTSG